MIIKPIRLDSKFGMDNMTAYKSFVSEALDTVVNSHRQRVKSLKQDWDHLYRGVPQEESRSFPWENASNIVVQIIGSHTDTLTAWVMGSIFELDPIWPIKALGSWSDDLKKEQCREALEMFLQEQAIDPEKLDIYRVEQLWLSNAIKYGFSVVKVGYESVKEAVVSPSMDLDVDIYTGPRPETVNYEDFFVSNDFKTLDSAPFKAEVLYYSEQELRQRADSNKFNRDAVSKIIHHGPDDHGYTFNQIESNKNTGISTQQKSKAFSRWHVFECWVKYYLNGRIYSTVCYYHLASKTFLGGYFNALPSNEEPYISARLGYRTSDMYGIGFCELLKHAQIEATATHNRRNDNATIANLRMVRVSPKATRIGSNFKVHPFAVLRADEDEIEAIQLGEVYPSTFQEEQLLLSEAADRAGVVPAVTGMGSGTVNLKKGIYSSQGTYAVLQAGTRRVNLDTMDMRYAHMKLGRKLLNLYSFFNVSTDTLTAFGQQGNLIVEAFKEYRLKRMALSVRATTASINRELERQNDVFLLQILNRHTAAQGQYLQSILGPQVPQEIKQYLVDVFTKSNALVSKIFRNFGYDNPTSFIPESSVVDDVKKQQQMIEELRANKNANSNIPSEQSAGTISFGGKSTIPTGSSSAEGSTDDVSGEPYSPQEG